MNGFGNDSCVLRSSLGWQRPFDRDLSEIASPDIIHRKIMPPFLLAGLMDRHDIRMAQVSSRLGFSAKPQDLLFAGELAGEDHLQRYRPVQADLAGPVHNAHAASGNFLQQFVIAKTNTQHVRRWSNV